MLPDLIQNVGIVIIQARNQVKFRAILGVSIAILSLVLQIILSKFYEEIGCAIAIAVMFFLGQGIIMNVYYSRKQALNIILFWKEIFRMSIVPVIVIVLSTYVVHSYSIDSWKNLLVSISLFCGIYIPLFFIFSMNRYERNLLISPLLRIVNTKLK